MIPTITATSPSAKVALPHQSIVAGAALAELAQRVVRPDRREDPDRHRDEEDEPPGTGASTPPRTRPMNEPAIAAMLLMPRASPRSFCRERVGQDRARVREQERAADTLADAHHDQPERARVPCIQVTESRIEKTVKTAKPRLNIRTRP